MIDKSKLEFFNRQSTSTCSGRKLIPTRCIGHGLDLFFLYYKINKKYGERESAFLGPPWRTAKAVNLNLVIFCRILWGKES